MLFLFYFSSCNCVMYRAATVNRNIGYPRFRTHGSVSVRLFQISVQVVFFNYFFVKTDILTGKSYKIYGPVIIILLLSFKERENMAPSCKFKSPVWEHFDFLVAILSLFYVCCWKNMQIYIMSTCFGCEIQTVSSCLNRTKITENRRQKLKPNRNKSEP